MLSVGIFYKMLFVVAVFEEFKLMQCCSMLVSIQCTDLNTWILDMLSAFNLQFKHMRGTSKKIDICVVIFSFPQTINPYSTCANKYPLNATITLSCLNLLILKIWAVGGFYLFDEFLWRGDRVTFGRQNSQNKCKCDDEMHKSGFYSDTRTVPDISVPG